MVKKIRNVARIPLKITRLKLKHNVFNSVYRVDQSLKGGLRRSKPVWYEAVRSNPPNDVFYAHKAIIPEETGSFPAHSGKKKVPFYYLKPQPIEYPEDKVRNMFYKSHPFELTRPRSMIQFESSFSTYDWSKNIYGGRADIDVSGENVVQRTMFFSQQISLKEAYKKALEEFYAVRAQEEDTRARVLVAASKHSATVTTSLTSLLGGPTPKQDKPGTDAEIRPATSYMHGREEYFMQHDLDARKAMANRRQNGKFVSKS